MIAKVKKISNYRELEYALPTEQYIDPKEVFVSLTNNRCKSYTLDVKEGELVKLGQRIGARDCGFFTQPIISTVSGVVGDKVTKWDGTGFEAEFITITNDFKDTLDASIKERTDDEVDALSREDIVEIIKDNMIVGLGGSAFPTYIKLGTKETIHTVVVNAVECEPYLSSDYRIIRDNPAEIVKGLLFAMRAVNAQKGVLAVKKTKKTLIKILKEEITKYQDVELSVAALPDYYPQGWENDMFENALGIKVPPGELPMTYGLLGINVSTANSIYDAIKFNRPIIKRYVTVNGDALNFPQNIMVRVGTSAKDLIELCDGFVEDANTINLISGGPMMGRAMDHEDFIVTPTTTSVLAFKTIPTIEEPCVRCGACIYNCPVDIQPVQIMNAVKNNNKVALAQLNTNKCIECGLCAYVCTSKIQVTDYIRKGKAMLR